MGLVSEIKKWGEFVKFSHTIFALPFAVSSMLVAARETRGWPGWRLFFLILAAMVTARTCAMAFNRIVDREIDKLNPRTADRHLPAGRISLFSAWTLCVSSGIGFLVVCWWINPLCFYLAPVALGVACFYSLTKRFTDFTHLYLGLALALAPVGAWLAVEGGFNWWPIRNSFLLPLIMGVAVFFWLVGFDIIYSIQDYEFDKSQGLHSLVVAWGPKNALKASFLAHMLMWGLLAVYGLLSGFRVAYFTGMGIMLLCLLLEHWLAKRRKMNWVQIAFFRLNGLISLIFVTVVFVEVYFPGFRLVR